MLPRNAQAIVAARERGLKPSEMVFVSFVGHTGFDEPHVYAESGQNYDWRFLRDLQVAIVVKPEIDASHAIRAIFAELVASSGYPWLVDVERKQVCSIVDTNPMKVWPVARGSTTWRGFFS